MTEMYFSPWKVAALTAGAIAALTTVGTVIFIYSGTFNVAATDPHSAPAYWMMEKTRARSIQVHAAGIAPPEGIDSQDKIVAAAGHFAAHCAICHGGPGIDRDEFAKGMYPLPPDLTKVSQRYTAAELFWILKNGIKMSGMPSMADDGDQMLWSTVAFLQRLPTMSPDDYNELWMASQTQGGMGHMMNTGGMNMAPSSAGALGTPDAPKQ